MKTIIAVAGGSAPSPEEERMAFQVGCALAKSGAVLLCGGLGGIMTAACKGARSAGGITIGILPGKSKSDANPYVDYAIPTGMSDARNLIVALGGDALIAIGGHWGTLSEISLAMKNQIPVIGLKSWEMDAAPRGGKNISIADTPEQAVEKALRHAGRDG